MRVSIVILTDIRQLAEDITLFRNRLLPENIQQLPYYHQRGAVFSVSSFLFRGNIEEFDIFMSDLRLRSDGLLLICQSSVKHVAEEYDHVFFSTEFYISETRINIRNVFGKILAKTIKDFAVFSIRFDDIKYQKIFILPLRNFMADELVQIEHLLSIENPRQRFGPELDNLLGRIRKRQKPKQPKKSAVEYLVDDSDVFFAYGHERHMRPETGMPRHNHLCVMSSDYRFGRSFDSERHFNLSRQPDGATIAGTFLNCHDEEVTFSERQHVNLCPNDFCSP